MQAPSVEFLKEFESWVFDLQKRITETLNEIEEDGEFVPHKWERHDGRGHGIASVIEGKILEKGGVNVSSLTIPLNKGLYNTMKEKNDIKTLTEDELKDYEMFACGISSVIHPANPHVPTTHFNYRVLVIVNKVTQEASDWWFGGGADLTPIYLNEVDAIHFHNTLKMANDPFGTHYFEKFKAVCDDYFCIKYRSKLSHLRRETRSWRHLH